jgi:hypothetical protein
MTGFKWTIRTTFGFIIGILSPAIMLPLTMLVIAWAQNYEFDQLLFGLKTSFNTQSKLLSLSIIPSLLWFFLFLNRERYEQAYGIIFGSIMYLPFVFYVNFLR